MAIKSCPFLKTYQCTSRIINYAKNQFWCILLILLRKTKLVEVFNPCSHLCFAHHFFLLKNPVITKADQEKPQPRQLAGNAIPFFIIICLSSTNIDEFCALKKAIFFLEWLHHTVLSKSQYRDKAKMTFSRQACRSEDNDISTCWGEVN